MPDDSLPTPTTPASATRQPNSGITDVPQIPEAIADSFFERAVEYLRRQVVQLFQDVLGHEQTAHHHQQNLDLLMARYHIEKSRISHVTDWYGRLPWYKRYAGGVLFVATSALVGAVFNLAALFSILAIGLHYMATTLVMEHDTLTARRDEQFCTDIINMEKKLAESIEVLVDTANQVNEHLTALRVKNNQVAEHTQTLDAQTVALTDKAGQLTTIIHALEQTGRGLMGENERITHQFQQACLNRDALQQEHTAQSTMLDAVAHELDDTNQALWVKTQALADIYDQFQCHLTALAKPASACKASMNSLQSGHAETKGFDVSPTESGSDVQVLQANTDQLLNDSDALLAQVTRRHDDDSAACSDTKTKDLSTEALLARVARQVEALEANGSSRHFEYWVKK